MEFGPDINMNRAQTDKCISRQEVIFLVYRLKIECSKDPRWYQIYFTYRQVLLFIFF